MLTIAETVHLYGMLLVCKLLLTLCLLIACPIRLKGTSLGRNLPIKDTTELELKFNIAKHIIDVKLQEQEDRLLESEKKAKRQKILDLMAKKQDAELEGKSLEELAKELEALN